MRLYYNKNEYIKNLEPGDLTMRAIEGRSNYPTYY